MQEESGKTPGPNIVHGGQAGGAGGCDLWGPKKEQQRGLKGG